MVATTTRPRSPARLPRFDRVERALHWANAVLFAVLMGTAAILYVGSALADPDALLGMVRGWVPARWARERRPRWHDELQGDE